jgi:hypothetical protein
MTTSIEKAEQRLQRKIRKASNYGRAAAGRLDDATNGLEDSLRVAINKALPKVAAAAVIKKLRTGIADSERSTALRNGEPLTDTKSAAKARKKAIKAKLKADQAEASAAEARERLNKGADMDTIVTIAKSVISGKPSAFTKRDFFVELQKRADENRRPGETRERAFTRYATTHPTGQVLMQAHKAARGDDYTGEPDDKTDDEPATNDAYRRLMDLAAEKREKGETVEQAFARLYADPKYRDLVATEKRAHTDRVAKAMGIG